MTPAQLLIGFFFFMLAAVSAAGYVFVLRPSRTEGPEAEIPAPIALGHDMPKGQAAIADLFRVIGEAVQVHPAHIGLGSEHVPKFARRYASVGESISRAVAEYGDDVRSGRFPSDEESFHLAGAVREQLAAARRK